MNMSFILTYLNYGGNIASPNCLQTLASSYLELCSAQEHLHPRACIHFTVLHIKKKLQRQITLTKLLFDCSLQETDLRFFFFFFTNCIEIQQAGLL